MTDTQVEAAIELAERVGRGEVKPSTLRRVKPITAMMIMLWLWRRKPHALRALPEEMRAILWARVGFDWMDEDKQDETKKDKRRHRK